MSVVSLISPGGDETVEGGLRMLLDAYGAFGSSAPPAGDAQFNPPGSFSGDDTVYESAVYIRGAGVDSFLAEGSVGSSGYLPSVDFTSTSTSSAVSAFSRGSLGVVLTQRIEDRFNSSNQKVGSMLVQDYQITNNSSSTVDFSALRYLDGDLYYVGEFDNDWGGASTTERSMNQQLFEFDSGDDPNNPTSLIGIRAIGGTVPEKFYEIDSYSGLRTRVADGTALDNSIAGDFNNDLVTDSSYDVTLALQRDYHLPSGQTQHYITVTEYGLGTTAATPIQPIAEQQRTGNLRGWPYHYDVGFNSSQELVAHIRVDLVGDAPVGPNGENLAAIWETGIESTWSGKYEVADGNYRYPVSVDIEWVDANADYTVTVHSGNGGVDALNFYTEDPSGWGFGRQGIIAAHEAGHWLGLYDEYNPMNNGSPAWWPLYRADGTVLTDFWGLYDSVNGNPRPDWAALSAGSDGNALMASLGEMEPRYYQALVNWLAQASGRTLVLAQAPTYTTWSPVNGFTDPQPGTSGHAPDDPYCLAPANARSITSTLTPTLVGTAFSDLDGDTHTATRWQVSKNYYFPYMHPAQADTGQWDYIWDSGVDAQHLTSVTLPDNIVYPGAGINGQTARLSNGFYYWYRFQYQDSTGEWSNWSPPCWFKFGENPCTPYALLPKLDAVVSLQPMLVVNEFVDDVGQYHETARWQAATNYQFTQGLQEYTDPNPTAGSVEWRLNFTIKPNTRYYWRVQFQDNTGLWGNWSTVGWFVTGSALQVDSNALAQPGGAAISDDELTRILPAAVARLESVQKGTGALLANATLQVADLPEGILGLATRDAILIDRDAAGYGWFVDVTPASDQEFQLAAGRRELSAIDALAVDRIDLLTVVEHELGHLAGLPDLDATLDGLMSARLGTGMRRGVL